MHFSRRHDRKLSCTYTHTQTHTHTHRLSRWYQLTSADLFRWSCYAMQAAYQPLPDPELPPRCRRRWWFSSSGCRADRRLQARRRSTSLSWKHKRSLAGKDGWRLPTFSHGTKWRQCYFESSAVPDAVGEEEVRWMDGGQLRQEGGRNRDGDVTGGRHATFIMHIPADTITTTSVVKQTLTEQIKQVESGERRHSAQSVRVFFSTWRSGLWWSDILLWRRFGRKLWTTLRNRNLIAHRKHVNLYLHSVWGMWTGSVMFLWHHLATTSAVVQSEFVHRKSKSDWI